MNEKRNLVDLYLKEMLKANEYMNLTNIKNEEQAKALHIEDSLSALDIFGKIPNDTLIVIHDYDRIEYHVDEDYYQNIIIVTSKF